MSNKQYVIIFAIVVVGVIAAGFAAKKLGLNSYEEYSPFDQSNFDEYKKAA